MANTLITPTWVLRESLRILHEKLSFIGTINRTYDNTYVVGGAKRGDTLKIRKPNRYTVTSGATLSNQDTEEETVDLVTSTQKHVSTRFTSAEMTLDLQDFSSRVLAPMMSVLAADIENDALQTMTKDVHNIVGSAGSAADFEDFLNARARLNQNLAPKDNNRYVQMNSLSSVALVNELKGLFHQSDEISRQYREGLMGRTAGFDFYENEKVLSYAQGADVAGAVDDAGATIASGDSTVPVDGFTAALTVGDVVTFADVYAVHPETKAAYPHLQQFVITAATTTLLTIDPPIYSTGAKQNVDALPADNAAVALAGSPSASTTYQHDLAYHRDAFAFTTADLELPQGTHFAAREVMDGISMRIISDYDITNDRTPTRIDVLYGYVTQRPELACRVIS